MTINNYTINQNPLANPFNSRVHGNYCVQRQSGTNFYINRTTNPNSLQVPQSKPYDPTIGYENQNLEVPHQNQIPMGQESGLPFEMQMNPERFYTSPDGTVFDLNTNKMIVKGKYQNNAPGCWGDGKVKWQKSSEPEWNNRDIYSLGGYEQTVGLSKDDIAYNEMSKKMNQKLQNNMSDEQKQLLDELNSGKITRKSKIM